MSKLKKFTNQEIIQIIQNSISIAEAIKKLGLKPAAGNYRTIYNFIKKHNIDTSHLKRQAWSKGKKVGPKRDISLYLKNEIFINSSNLRKRLIHEKFFEERCCQCNLTHWNDKPIPLQLHHIDGNHTNNNLSNLMIICPNCHAQTDNYCGVKNTKDKLCILCNTKISSRAKLCKSCHFISVPGKMKKSITGKRPNKDLLEKQAIELNWNFSALGRFYQVSDNCVKKWLKGYNLSKP